jgi:ornithine cyclodeaminase/alanine dehydrogenase-like protein (mu-crystallin family)
MSTLVLTRAEIAGLMTPADYLGAVETAFRLSKEGRTEMPLPMAIHGVGGGAFHAKAAAMFGGRKLVALKLNGNFPDNPARGLPTIQGVILLCDANTGAVLAIMDSIEITLRRTAAASALAAKHLARAGAETLAIIGCGAQARAQVEALEGVLPLKRGIAFDSDLAKARAFTSAMGDTLPFEAASSLRAATLGADVIVTCTTARAAFLDVGDISPGAFIAAVGADNPEKSEIAPALMANAGVVTDVLAQCLIMGDLHHAVKASVMTADQVRAELSDLVTGARRGRVRDDEIVIFDSTGSALQDVASAAVVHTRALERGVGLNINLNQ